MLVLQTLNSASSIIYFGIFVCLWVKEPWTLRHQFVVWVPMVNPWSLCCHNNLKPDSEILVGLNPTWSFWNMDTFDGILFLDKSKDSHLNFFSTKKFLTSSQCRCGCRMVCVQDMFLGLVVYSKSLTSCYHTLKAYVVYHTQKLVLSLSASK